MFGKDKIDIDQVTLAIAEFERPLVTANGRFNLKVPTRRNVEMTYPDFHDGAANTRHAASDAILEISPCVSGTGAAAPVFLVCVCLIPVNLPVHWRVHNLPLIPFGFSPDA